MDEKTKELIAVGTSVGAHCQPCLTYHVAKAKEQGIDDDLIREAIKIGHMVDKGAMAAMRKYAAGIFDGPAETGAGCCSGGDNNKGCCA